MKGSLILQKMGLCHGSSLARNDFLEWVAVAQAGAHPEFGREGRNELLLRRILRGKMSAGGRGRARESVGVRDAARSSSLPLPP